jgi:sugar phosphate permease
VVAILFFFIRDYKTVALVKTVSTSGGGNRIQMSKRDVCREFLHIPSLLLTNVGFAGCIFTTTAILTWLPTYFHRMEGIPMSAAGMKTGLIMMLAIIGGPLGGWLADVWFKRRVSARLLFPALSTALTALVLYAAFAFFQGKQQYWMLLLMGILIVSFAPADITVTQEVIHTGLRATSYAV